MSLPRYTKSASLWFAVIPQSNPPVFNHYYLRKDVFFRCGLLSVGLRKNYQRNFYETWWKGVTWAKKELITHNLGADLNHEQISEFSARYGIWPLRRFALSEYPSSSLI